MTAAPTLPLPDSVHAVIALLATQSYVCDRRLATALYVSLKLQRPLFLEGEPFDAFLLEVLAAHQLTVHQLGTIRASAAPITIITSTRTREIYDALKRRCLYHWVDFPSLERELEIVRLKAPGAADRLYLQVVEFVQRMRTLDLFKLPGVAETIDWTNALMALNAMRLDPATVHDTLGVLLKHQDDIVKLQSGDTAKLLDELRARALLD